MGIERERAVPAPDRRAVAAALAAARLGPVAAMGGRTLRSPDVAAALLPRPGELDGAVLLRSRPEIDLDDVRATLDRFFAEVRPSPVVLSSPWPLPDGVGTGWVPCAPWALMALDSKPAGPGAGTVRDGAVHVDEVVDREGLAAWQDARRSMSGADASGPWLDERALADGCLRLYLARGAGRALAVAAAYADRQAGVTLVDVITPATDRSPGPAIGPAIATAVREADPRLPAVLVLRDPGAAGDRWLTRLGTVHRWARTVDQVHQRTGWGGA